MRPKGRTAGFSIVLGLFALILGGVFLSNKESVFRILHHVDQNYLGESLKEVTALFKSEEDWSALSVAKGQSFDYRWLSLSPDLIKIAHRLGDYDNPNTLTAFQNSRNEGFIFFEVDLWLDATGVLRCYHGPKKPGPLKSGSCTFQRLIDFLHDGEYVILDIKTDFLKTSTAILKHVENNPYSQQIIFHLYLPEHVEHFSHWAKSYQLAGPIVAAYKSSRSVNHIYHGIGTTGLRAFAFPIDRLPAFNADSKSEIMWFIHPVRSCSEMNMARKMSEATQLKGIYVKNSLKCEDES